MGARDDGSHACRAKGKGRAVTKGQNYTVGCNTGGATNFTSYRAALREWGKVAPGAEAGPFYHAWFLAMCPACGAWHDARPESLGEQRRRGRGGRARLKAPVC